MFRPSINAFERFLRTSAHKTIPTSTLCDLIRMILTMNNFYDKDEDENIEGNGRPRAFVLYNIFTYTTLLGIPLYLSLCSKRFRSVSEQRKTEEWDCQF